MFPERSNAIADLLGKNVYESDQEKKRLNKRKAIISLTKIANIYILASDNDN